MTTTIDDTRIIDRLGYEVAVQRELMTMAHRIARLEMALGAARASLEIIAPHVEGPIAMALHETLERIDRALAEKEI